MRKPDVPCSACGKLLYGGGHGSLPAGERTCRPCRALRSAKPAAEPHSCPVCETPTLRPVFCTSRCAELDKQRRRRAGLTGAKARDCEICASAYRPTYPRQRTCSRSCGWELRLREGTAQPARPPAPRQLSLPGIRRCGHCAETFIGLRRKYCSPDCAAEAKLIGDREYRRARARPHRMCCRCGRRPTPSKRRVLCDSCLRTTKRNRKRRERRRIRNLLRNVASELYTLEEIAERDRFVCQLCRKRVAMKKQVPHPKAPTIDHVVPRADGGDDTRANVQLAHFMCNCLKSNRGSQQLALIG